MLPSARVAHRVLLKANQIIQRFPRLRRAIALTCVLQKFHCVDAVLLTRPLQHLRQTGDCASRVVPRGVVHHPARARNSRSTTVNQAALENAGAAARWE
jgi:hypothetical protein